MMVDLSNTTWETEMWLRIQEFWRIGTFNVKHSHFLSCHVMAFSHAGVKPDAMVNEFEISRFAFHIQPWAPRKCLESLTVADGRIMLT